MDGWHNQKKRHTKDNPATNELPGFLGYQTLEGAVTRMNYGVDEAEPGADFTAMLPITINPVDLTPLEAYDECHRRHKPAPVDGILPDQDEVYELWADLAEHYEQCTRGAKASCPICNRFGAWIDRHAIGHRIRRMDALRAVCRERGEAQEAAQ